MTNQIESVPKAAREAAAALIRQQDRVPQSPLRRLKDGRVELCAAAALIIANTVGNENREALITRFAEEGREAVIESFARLQWPKELGSRLLQTNDAFDEEDRKTQVLALFDGSAESL
ncbi:hypothetical protein [Bradyrhizobium sp. CCGE-LA001]|uniref:hypothetical protein n=1 Tax=Bradyrhizobium sp. CCGE-LA001 TaxID=1223566 RepID=UPI0002AA6728|nr:hypothetical protein [Bradyrhizobium sp. CCGE-LA001]